MTHKDINYTKGKIFQALHILALHEGKLRERVPQAYYELSPASYFAGYEAEAATIHAITDKVVHGDWTNVSDNEMKEIAVAIWTMSERSHQ